MNVVELNFGALGVNQAMFDNNIKSIIKTLAYIGTMSSNVVQTNQVVRDSQGGFCEALSMTANLNFSISNVSFSADALKPTLAKNGTENWIIPPLVSKPFYDTSCQSVREWIEEPHAVRGYMVYLVNDTVNNADISFEDDMDDFIKVTLFKRLSAMGDVTSQIDLYIGTCKAGLTDFYTPFAGVNRSRITYLDMQKINDRLGSSFSSSQSSGTLARARHVARNFANTLPQSGRVRVPDALERSPFNQSLI